MNKTVWSKQNSRTTSRRNRVRCEQAWSSDDGAWELLLYRPCSRTARGHRRIGYWCLVHEGTLVRRGPVYGRRVRTVPWRWAARSRREYQAGGDGQTCTLVDARRPTLAESLVSTPPAYDELPPVLVGPPRGRAGPHVPRDTDPQVPTLLPIVSPVRTLRPRLAGHVLCREEYDDFVQVWREWMTDHPELRTPEGRGSLAEFCMSHVRLNRILKHWTGPRAKLAARLYHAEFHRSQAIRRAIGATRAQRMTD